MLFDSQGSPIGKLQLTIESIFDTLITDTYVIYLSDQNADKIIRIEPNIQC